MVQGIISILTLFLGCKVEKKLDLYASFPRKREPRRKLDSKIVSSFEQYVYKIMNFLGSRFRGNDAGRIGPQLWMRSQ
jgi:hypothetical protein